MPETSDKILELLIKNTADTAATRAKVEEVSAQIAEVFMRLHSVEEKQNHEKGKEEGQRQKQQRASDFWARILSAGAVLFTFVQTIIFYFGYFGTK
jgi:hypothetical protein